jgi:hypothetical protein
MSMQMEERLWEYIDGLSTEEEKAAINRLLHTDPEWKGKYDEIMELQELLNSSSLDEPSMRFTQNVMEEISRLYISPSTKTYINKKIIYSIGGFFIIMIVGLLVYSIGQVNWAASNGSSFSINVDRADWGKLLNNSYLNIFMMINVLLGLMLLDKYLSNKKDALRKRNI